MVHSNYLGDDPTKERNMKEGKKKRRNEERQEGPYKGAEGTRELVVALLSAREKTNKQTKESPDRNSSRLSCSSDLGSIMN